MTDSMSLMTPALRRIKLNHEKEEKIHLLIWLTDAQLLDVSSNSVTVSASYSFIDELKVTLLTPSNITSTHSLTLSLLTIDYEEYALGGEHCLL